MEQIKECPGCGFAMNYKKGTSKTTGKPWQGYFCENDKTHVEWIRENNVSSGVKPYKPIALKSEPNWNEINARKEEGMTFLNAKNNAAILLAAAIQKGDYTLDEALERYDSIIQKVYDCGKES